MNIKSKKGITLISLIVTIIVIIIIAGSLAYGADSYIEQKKKTYLDTDLTKLTEKVEQYYATNKELPILNKYTNLGEWRNVATLNDNENYYIIDLNKIGGLNMLKLHYGVNDFKLTNMIEVTTEINDMVDIYIINEKSHIVYYPKGIPYYGETIYTLDEPISKVQTAFTKIVTDGSWSDTEKVNTPKLKNTGLTAVYWDNNGKQKELTNNSPASEWENWYNYDENKWANAVTKDKNGNITGYFVWIPRFAYKITSGLGTNNAGEIEIQFLQGTTNKNAEGKEVTRQYTNIDEQNNAMFNFVVHPAFTNGTDNNFANGEWDKEIEGFWMAKFEAGYAGDANNPSSAVDSNVKYSVIYSWNGSEDTDVTTIYYGDRAKDSTNIKYPVFKANRPSMNYIGISDAYDLCMDIKNGTSVYGLKNVDSHLTKNSEWGAVAYLTHSKYGRNGQEVRINNVCDKNSSTSSVYAVTGYGASSHNEGQDITRELSVLTTEGQLGSWTNTQLQTSTGNIYGIYDLSGGLCEWTAGYIETLGNYELYGGSLKGDSSKYKSKYAGTSSTDTENYSSDLNSGRIGEAIWETSSSGTGSNEWNSDFSNFCKDSLPFLGRGGYWNNNSKTGIYAFNNNVGYCSSYVGFRPILIVN